MSRSTNEIIRQIAYQTTGAELSDGETLQESGLDSLSLVTVIAEIEDRWKISFSDGDLDPEQLLTLADLVRITEKYL